MFISTFENGIPAFLSGLNTPEAGYAFRLTLITTVIAVGVNTVAGIILALVIARQRFPGLMLLDEMINLPLAISPVVAGFMFILLYGKKRMDRKLV